MRYLYSLMVTAFVACFLVLAGCEPATPPTKPVEAPKVEAVKPRNDQPLGEFTAQMMTVASHIGALHHCRADKLYVSPTIEDTYYRMRGIMLGLQKTEQREMLRVGNMAYAAYERSFMEGKVFLVAVSPESHDRFSVVEIDVPSEDACKTVEKMVDTYRQKGGVLDVKPDRSGLSGIRDQDG